MTPTDKPIGHRILKPEAGRANKAEPKYGKAYVHGNIVEGNEKVTNDNWAGGVQIEDQPDAGNFLNEIKVDKPFPMAEFPIISAKQSYDYVLSNAGAILPVRDAVDKRIVETVKTGKPFYVDNAIAYQPKFIKRRLPADSYKQGIIYDIRQVGGYPQYKGTPYKDTDKDGMPDAYEKANGLNPRNAADAVKIAKNGYSNIENYLNSLVNLETVTP